MSHTPAPWKACRSHEDFDGPMWEVDADTVEYFNNKPFVRIEAASGTVAAAHDLFEFKPDDAALIEAAPELLDALQRMVNHFAHDDPGNLAANDPKGCAVYFARAAIAKATQAPR